MGRGMGRERERERVRVRVGGREEHHVKTTCGVYKCDGA